eukprot:CAMPEP_0174342190 /NCGR_PEP_ID=MMETSP0810-20121108/25973_1 /TAXON_ID=73025 ORGANISM="Eutreptiella gymnastica-like, Strain CCMP1594" /NCGR_SAMPLE_ID=MMETSP0810 /ASSEMBLY_ACC=CAM_ASM_000659 /LENGTH=76 /DNA_ID=CAMNT_0015464197 /DNA_START=362 /DNA_END=592 /DNA_ORIENTATION=-
MKGTGDVPLPGRWGHTGVHTTWGTQYVLVMHCASLGTCILLRFEFHVGAAVRLLDAPMTAFNHTSLGAQRWCSEAD